VTTIWSDPQPSTSYGIHALPYGAFSVGGGQIRLGVRIGDRLLDLAAAARRDAPDLLPVVDQASLDRLMAAGSATWSRLRTKAAEWLSDETHADALSPHLHQLADVQLAMPFTVGDYVDFYSSRHHAENLGLLFRPGQPALTANWLHLPIGYHGRAGTVMPSGTDVVRPSGQRRPDPGSPPVFGPSTRLDIEAEVGFVVGTPSRLGNPVSITEAAEHVFGVVLVNDWSARDLQSWEYVPLGPFLGKSFATSISHWVLPLQALQSARVTPPEREVELLPYLQEDQPWGLDIDLEVYLNGQHISSPPFRHMYWTLTQQLAHLTANGASLRTGDLYASGTVSGPEETERGSFIELSWNGQVPLKLADGSTRSFLEDEDEVVITATAPGPDGSRIGLGEVRGRIRSTINSTA
jgi:fumarylacetoacetase